MPLFELGTRVLDTIDVRDEARRVMTELVASTGESVDLAIRDGDSVVFIDKIDGTAEVRAFTRSGQRAWLHATAAGKVFLAARCRPPSSQAYLDGPLDAYTPATITDPASSPGSSRRRAGGAGRSTAASCTSRRARSPCRCSTRSGRCVAALGLNIPLSRLDDDHTRLMVDAALRGARTTRARARRVGLGIAAGATAAGGVARDGALTDGRRRPHPRLTPRIVVSRRSIVPSLFIDGQWVASGDGTCAPVINPSDGSIVAEVDIATDDQVQSAIAAARRAFDTTDWPRTPTADRAALLDRVADLLDRDQEALAAEETLNTGKAMRESRWDMADVAKVFRYYADLADKGAGRLVDASNPSIVSRIVYEPVGVCGLIGPWNYPLLQLSWKIAPALAAGNTAVMKPASLTPLTAIHLTRLLEEAGVPAGVVNLVLGPGDRVGQALADSPDVDLISLTGGIEAGRSLVRGAAVNMKKIAMELGGKSPNIVFADADFETAVDNALTAAFVHSGQVCSAGCRAIVQDEIYDAFVAELGRRADRIRLGPGTDEATETGALISAAHREKVEGYVASAIADGARLVAGGRRPDEPSLQGGLLLPPDGVRRRPPRHAHRARGGVRPRPDHRAFLHGGRGDRARERHDLWARRRRLDVRREPRPARRGAPSARHDLDQRLQRLRAAGRVGRVQAVRHRARARRTWPRRVPRGEAHLAEHGPRTDGLVRRLTGPDDPVADDP